MSNHPYVSFFCSIETSTDTDNTLEKLATLKRYPISYLATDQKEMIATTGGVYPVGSALSYYVCLITYLAKPVY